MVQSLRKMISISFLLVWSSDLLRWNNSTNAFVLPANVTNAEARAVHVKEAGAGRSNAKIAHARRATVTSLTSASTVRVKEEIATKPDPVAFPVTVVVASKRTATCMVMLKEKVVRATVVFVTSLSVIITAPVMMAAALAKVGAVHRLNATRTALVIMEHVPAKVGIVIKPIAITPPKVIWVVALVKADFATNPNAIPKAVETKAVAPAQPVDARRLNAMEPAKGILGDAHAKVAIAIRSTATTSLKGPMADVFARAADAIKVTAIRYRTAAPAVALVNLEDVTNSIVMKSQLAIMAAVPATVATVFRPTVRTNLPPAVPSPGALAMVEAALKPFAILKVTATVVDVPASLDFAIKNIAIQTAWDLTEDAVAMAEYAFRMVVTCDPSAHVATVHVMMVLVWLPRSLKM